MNNKELKEKIEQFILLSTIEKNGSTESLNRIKIKHSEIIKMISIEIKNDNIAYEADKLILTDKGKEVIQNNREYINKILNINENINSSFYSFFKISNEDDFFLPNEDDL